VKYVKPFLEINRQNSKNKYTLILCEIHIKIFCLLFSATPRPNKTSVGHKKEQL
jgi:hypothetical protein